MLPRSLFRWMDASKPRRHGLAAGIGVIGLCLSPAAVRATETVTTGTADSAAVGAPVPPGRPRAALPPTAALGIGLGATVLPTILAYGVTSANSQSEDIGLFAGPAIGIIAGPSMGLWSGGRGDLAKRGALRRSAGVAMALVAMGVASGTWNDGRQSPVLTVTLAILGVAGGIGAVSSALHDLAITPSATAEGSRPKVTMELRRGRMLAARMRF